MDILKYLRFLFLSLLKLCGYIIYPSKLETIDHEKIDWDHVSLILVLNHTSLFEFVFGVALPFRYLWKLSNKLVLPVAQDTLNRVVPRFVFSYIAPKTVGLTRKRDRSWSEFLSKIDADDICIFMPEGQMKRKNGLNKFGKKMIVRQGVLEVLKKYRSKNMVIFYSKGLHHVLAPGDRFPRFFRKIEAKLQYVSVDEYLKGFDHLENAAELVAIDLQKRRDRYCLCS